MDFHVRPIFVNLSLFVLAVLTGPVGSADERAILVDGETVPGRLAMDPAAGVVFRGPNGVLPVGRIRKVVQTGTSPIGQGSSPSHRLILWGHEAESSDGMGGRSLSGTVQSLDAHGVELLSPVGERLRVPLYLVSRIEHFQGDAVVLSDDFEQDEPQRHTAGDARRNSEQAASGRSSFRLEKPDDTLEYRLAQPLGSGWLEVRFFDSTQVQQGFDWLCELEFSSNSETRRLQILLGWGADSYGLATPQGPSLPVQHLTRLAGWNRLGVRFDPRLTSVLVNDAVLTYANVGLGFLRAVRFLVRPAADTEGGGPPAKSPAAYVDDLQIAEAIAMASEPQPAIGQDDLWLTSGDQLYGQLESGTGREVTIRGEFGSYSLPWPQLQGIHLSSRPVPPKMVEGQFVRVRYGSTAVAHARKLEEDVLEGVLREVSDDWLRLEHPHIGPVRIARGQVRELEFLWLGRWLSVDSGFHHFGDQVLPWLQVAHPEGSERTWSFKLDRVPHEAMLELHVVDLADMVKYPRQLQNDELRTYVSLNGQTVDPLGLNHLVPLSTKKPVRLNLAVPPELLKKGDNVLRIHQTPQQNPENLDDCGVFGIVLKLR